MSIEIKNPFNRDISPHGLLYKLGRSIPDGSVLVFEPQGQSDNAVYLANLGYFVFKADPTIASTLSFTSSARQRMLHARGIVQSVGEFNLGRADIARIHPDNTPYINNVVVFDPNLGLMNARKAEAQILQLMDITATQGLHIIHTSADPQGQGLVVTHSTNGENERLRNFYTQNSFDVLNYEPLEDGYNPNTLNSIVLIARKN